MGENDTIIIKPRPYLISLSSLGSTPFLNPIRHGGGHYVPPLQENSFFTWIRMELGPETS